MGIILQGVIYTWYERPLYGAVSPVGGIYEFGNQGVSRSEHYHHFYWRTRGYCTLYLQVLITVITLLPEDTVKVPFELCITMLPVSLGHLIPKHQEAKKKPSYRRCNLSLSQVNLMTGGHESIWDLCDLLGYILLLDFSILAVQIYIATLTWEGYDNQGLDLLTMKIKVINVSHQAFLVLDT